MFLAYRLGSFREDIDIDQYVQGVWIQKKPDNSLDYFNPVPCPQVFDGLTVSAQFTDQLHDMMCANMRGETTKIKNTGKKDWGYAWYFVIDTCEALAPFTGATNCKPNEEVRKIFNEFIVTTKIATQFFSEKTYIDNDSHTDTEFIIERFALSKSLGMFNHFTVEQITNTLSNQVYYSDQLLRDSSYGSETIMTYNTKPDLAKVYPYEDIHASLAEYAAHGAPMYAPLTVHFSQAQI